MINKKGVRWVRSFDNSHVFVEIDGIIEKI